GFKGEILRCAQNDKNSLLITHLYENSPVGRASVPASERRPGTAAPPTPAIFIFRCVRKEMIVGMKPL
ncbi:MAG: hypothetical protein KJ822_11290, partial [Proteobacteria bacterium]|nr:hypothetical protein [Pseudomonadota bacterium]